jgi:predicted nucleotidyltransferase
VTLRQEAVLDRLRGRIEAEDALEGALLLGSFATGSADELSDVDVLVVVAERRFDEAWAVRGRLEGDEAIAAWDDLDPARAEIGGHKWLTHDLVLVECLLATPSSGVRLAEPYSVLAGDASLPDRLARRDTFTRAELQAYASTRAEAGRLHEVEAAYGRLVDAVRSGGST